MFNTIWCTYRNPAHVENELAQKQASNRWAPMENGQKTKLEYVIEEENGITLKSFKVKTRWMFVVPIIIYS